MTDRGDDVRDDGACSCPNGHWWGTDTEGREGERLRGVADYPDDYTCPSCEKPLGEYHLCDAPGVVGGSKHADARSREAGAEDVSDRRLADALERFVTVDATGERLAWMTAGYDMSCREAMLAAASRLRCGKGEWGVDPRELSSLLFDAAYAVEDPSGYAQRGDSGELVEELRSVGRDLSTERERDK